VSGPAAAAFANPDADAIRATLGVVKTIAVVGYSPKADRPSHRIARALRAFGYRVIAVRPGIADAFGEKAYAGLADIPERIDLVDVFRNSAEAGAVVDECIALGIPRVWLQEGVVNEGAARRAQDAGMFVVMDRCIMRDYSRLMGSGA
jgi:predicted CoA-binding protein